MIKKIVAAILLIACCGLIFYMSACPPVISDSQSGFFVSLLQNLFHTDAAEPLTTIVRKVAHFSEFTLLGILSVNFFNTLNWKKYLGIIFGFLYAVSDEVHQLFVPGRSCEFRDMMIDFLGIMLGYTLFLSFGKLIIRIKKNTAEKSDRISDSES